MRFYADCISFLFWVKIFYFYKKKFETPFFPTMDLKSSRIIGISE